MLISGRILKKQGRNLKVFTLVFGINSKRSGFPRSVPEVVTPAEEDPPQATSSETRAPPTNRELDMGRHSNPVAGPRVPRSIVRGPCTLPTSTTRLRAMLLRLAALLVLASLSAAAQDSAPVMTVPAAAPRPPPPDHADRVQPAGAALVLADDGGFDRVTARTLR